MKRTLNQRKPANDSSNDDGAEHTIGTSSSIGTSEESKGLLGDATGGIGGAASVNVGGGATVHRRNYKGHKGHPENDSIPIWKYILLLSLMGLVALLIRVNYHLMNELKGEGLSDGSNGAGRKGSAGAAGSGGAVDTQSEDVGDSAGRKRLNSLRNQVSDMKEQVDGMKDVLNEIKKKQTAGAGQVAGEGGAAAGSKELSGKILPDGSLERLTCTPETTQKQLKRMNLRFQEWWSHSACPDQAWMEGISSLFDEGTMQSNKVASLAPHQKSYLVLDIGCNKGYTSADFFDALSPATNMNPHTLVDAIRTIASEDKTKFDRECGVCNDCKKDLNTDKLKKRNVEIHCFEPSPATYHMLVRAREKLMPGSPKDVSENQSKGDQGEATWIIHNVGLHEVNSKMSWHSACASAVGDELCTIVPLDAPDAITVPVVTVDSFLKETYLNDNSQPAAQPGNEPHEPHEPHEPLMPLVHMLKIDAEGLDPAVLTGSTTLLTQNRALFVMFEYNPGLSDKDPPHGMWGKRGNPRKTLLEVTDWLDDLGYDCYLDTRVPREDEGKRENKVVGWAPALYRITGGCLGKEELRVRGWANVVCACRRYGTVAMGLRKLATLVD